MSQHRKNTKKSTPQSKIKKIDGLKLLSDEAVNERNGRIDGLEFKSYSVTLSKIIAGTSGPFTIGVFGEWGTGKTSLMKITQNQLANEHQFVTVWFNAWMYEKEEHPIIPLIATITNAIQENQSFLKSLEDKGKSLTRTLKALAYGFSANTKLKIPGFAEVEASFVAKEMIDRESHLLQDPLLSKSIYYSAFENLSKVKINEDQRIVIFIDDLDRCFPDKAIKLLESIKLILGQLGFIFVLGVAREVLEGYLNHRYKIEYGLNELEGQKYLDKIIQLSFSIPPHNNRLKKLCTSLLNQIDEEHKQLIEPVIDLIETACSGIPRDVVRFINNIILDREIASIVSSNIPFPFFVVTRAMQHRWQVQFKAFTSSNDLCQATWTHLNQNQSTSMSPLLSTATGNNQNALISDSLEKDEDFRRLLENKTCRDWLYEEHTRNETLEFLGSVRSDSNFSTRIRVYELAKQLGVNSKSLAEFAISKGHDVKGHSSTMNLETAEKLREDYLKGYSVKSKLF